MIWGRPGGVKPPDLFSRILFRTFVTVRQTWKTAAPQSEFGRPPRTRPGLDEPLVAQAEADRDGRVDLIHQLLVHAPHFFPKAPLIQSADLFQ